MDLGRAIYIIWYSGPRCAETGREWRKVNALTFLHFLFFEINAGLITFAASLNSMTFITNKIKLIKIMKKKEYEKPTTQVVQLKQQPQLLAGSDVSATMDGEFEEIVI